MRFITIISLIILASGCATQPQPEPMPSEPPSVGHSPSTPKTAPETAIVIFSDDSDTSSQIRENPLVMTLRDQAISAFNQNGFDSLDGNSVTIRYMNQDGRRGKAEVTDSLSMFNEWGYALSLTYYIEAEQTDRYQKLRFKTNSKLYRISNRNLIKQWQESLPQHVIAPLNCDQTCIDQTLQPHGEKVITKIVNTTIALINKKEIPAPTSQPAPDQWPDYINRSNANSKKVAPIESTTDPKPESESEPTPEKGQWNPINF